MVKLFRYLKKREWIMAAVSLVFIISQVWLDLRLPEYMSEITVLVQTDGKMCIRDRPCQTANGRFLW